MQGFNWVDYIVLGILFFSTLVGLSRGVVREIISLATWFAAFFVASIFATPVANYFSSSSQAQAVISSASSSMGVNASTSVTWLAFGLSFIGLFILTMIAGAIINSVLSRAIEVSGISFANRLLGALFGMIRGFFLNILLMFLIQLVPQIMQEPWWTQSVFVNTLQPEVQWLASIVQPGLQTLKSQAGQVLQNLNSNVQQGVSSIYHSASP